MNPTQNPNTPRYNTSTGLLTDYGASLGLPQINVPNTLNGTQIAMNPQPLTLPIASPQGNFLQELMANNQSDINTAQTNFDRQQAQQDAGISDISSLMNQLTNQGADQVNAETQVGLPALNTSLRDLQTLSQRQLASYAQNIFNNDINAGGQTRSSQNGNEMMITRQHGIDAMITNANISAVSGQISTAQAQVDRAMTLKYSPIKQQIQNKLDILNLNKDSLNRADTKLAEAQKTKLSLQLKQLDKQQTDETAMQNMIIDASAQQAPASVLKTANDIIAKGGTPAQVATALGPYTGASAKAELLREQIKTEKAQQAKIYGDMRATSMSATGATAPEVLNTSIRLQIQDKIKAIDSAINNRGLNGAVGPNPIARSSFDFDIFTGVRQNFISEVEQIRSNLNLDTLIRAKASGATFGALSDNELQVLASAATKIGTWVIKDDKGRVVGYNTTEGNMREELAKIKMLAQRDLELRGGSIEGNYLDSITPAIDNLNDSALTPDPHAYWNTIQ